MTPEGMTPEGMTSHRITVEPFALRQMHKAPRWGRFFCLDGAPRKAERQDFQMTFCLSKVEDASERHFVILGNGYFYPYFVSLERLFAA
jgi:hypothetical protein